MLMGNWAYGTADNIAGCRQRGIITMLLKPRTENGSGLGIPNNLCTFARYMPGQPEGKTIDVKREIIYSLGTQVGFVRNAGPKFLATT
jgi:hypothetical protein